MTEPDARRVFRDLSDESIFKSLRELLGECGEKVELVDGELVAVNPDVSLVVVERQLRQTELDLGFGTHFKILVAVGGLESVELGIVVPKICFATLYLGLSGRLITCDFFPASWWLR